MNLTRSTTARLSGTFVRVEVNVTRVDTKTKFKDSVNVGVNDVHKYGIRGIQAETCIIVVTKTWSSGIETCEYTLLTFSHVQVHLSFLLLLSHVKLKNVN